MCLFKVDTCSQHCISPEGRFCNSFLEINTDYSGTTNVDTWCSNLKIRHAIISLVRMRTSSYDRPKQNKLDVMTEFYVHVLLGAFAFECEHSFLYLKEARICQ